MHSLSSESTLSRMAGDENTRIIFSFLKMVTSNERSAFYEVSHCHPDSTGKPNLRFLLLPL